MNSEFWYYFEQAYIQMLYCFCYGKAVEWKKLDLVVFQHLMFILTPLCQYLCSYALIIQPSKMLDFDGKNGFLKVFPKNATDEHL